MSNKQFLALAHLLLFMLQLVAMTMAILIDARFSALAPAISIFQGKLPAFPKMG